MNKKNLSPLDSALRELRELTRRIYDGISSKEQPEPAKLFKQGVNTRLLHLAEYGSLVLSGEDSDQYFDCVMNLHAAVDAKTGQISFGVVESATQLAILKALDGVKKQPTVEFPQRLETALGELRKTLCEPPITWSVHLEVAGLERHGLPRTVGNTEFYVMDQNRLSGFEVHVATIVDRMRYTAAEKGPAKKMLLDQMSHGLLGKTCAHVRISATDANAANALALKRLRQTLDVTNFFASILGIPGARVYLPWEASPHQAQSLTFADNRERLNWGSSLQGPSFPFSFSQIQGRRADEIGFSRASAILRSINPNPIENRLLSALQWAGRASVEERKEEAFLLFTVALESLLLDNREKQQLRYRFAIRGAHLLGNGLKSRRDLSSALRKLYDLRSAMVHSGSTDITDSDQDTVRHLAKRTIYRVLATKPFSNMTTEEELERWFEDQILGPDNSPIP